MILKKGRNGLVKILRDRAKFGISYQYAELRGQASSDRIKAQLLTGRPSMICRFGSTELNALLGYLGQQAGHRPSLANHVRFITGAIPSYGFDPEMIWCMSNMSGFFSSNVEQLTRFGELMIRDMEQVDILGTWRREEIFFSRELARATKVELIDLEPYEHEHPWSEVLAGRKVLLVHPFENSIRRQYARRELLFKDPRVLPAFDLRTIRAVQTVAGQPTSFRDWFEALDHMKARMDATDYDIAIIGAGAYGFPLAAHAKRMGKQAVHIGGATQLLFGIIGQRWEGHRLRNEHWVRPGDDERPEKAAIVEGACYW